MGLKRQILDRLERLVRANASQLDVIRERDQRVYALEQEVAAAKARAVQPLVEAMDGVDSASQEGKVCDAWLTMRDERDEAQAEVKRLKQAMRERDHSTVPVEDWKLARKERDEVQAKLDEALERGIAVAKQHSELRTLTGCAVGQSLEDRVQDLMGALNILVNEDNVLTMDRPRSLLDQIRMKLDAATWGSIIPAIERLQAQCAAVHPAEDMRLWRELAGCEGEQTLANRLEALTTERANWEVEALERAQSQTDLENRMDEASKLLGNMGDASLYPEVRQAQALLVRGEGVEITQAEAWERTARGFNERINAAVKVLEDVEEPSQPEMEALGLLTSDAAGDDPNIVDEGGEA